MTDREQERRKKKINSTDMKVRSKPRREAPLLSPPPPAAPLPFVSIKTTLWKGTSREQEKEKMLLSRGSLTPVLLLSVSLSPLKKAAANPERGEHGKKTGLPSPG